MRHFISRLLIGLLYVFSLNSAAEEGRTVTVGVNHAPPYRVITDEGVTGLYVDIFNEIAARIDWDVRYVEAPFRRVLRLMEEGRVDVMLGPLKTGDREQMMAFVAPENRGQGADDGLRGPGLPAGTKTLLLSP